MSLTLEFEAMNAKAEFIIAQMAMNLFNELQTRTPVDTGQLKTAWEFHKVADGWVFSNNMGYASFIFNGLKVIDNKTIGSKQLPDGVFPILQRHNIELTRRLDLLRG